MSAQPQEPCAGSFTVPPGGGLPSGLGTCAACGAVVQLGYAGRIPLHAPLPPEPPPRA
ncbi:MAG TPA: hypothetical protein VFA82_00445 [Gaiellaceae bacterium]|nr:hypothetical protein [Gaiellaceae bacterium]